MEPLNSENLIEIHEKLDEFARHHHNKGAKEVYMFIKKLTEDRATEPSVGIKEDQLIEEGYSRALYDLLSKLQDELYSSHTS